MKLAKALYGSDLPKNLASIQLPTSSEETDWALHSKQAKQAVYNEYMSKWCKQLK